MNSVVLAALEELKEFTETMSNQPPFKEWGVAPHIALTKTELAMWFFGSKRLSSINTLVEMDGFPIIQGTKLPTYPWPAVNKWLMNYGFK